MTRVGAIDCGTNSIRLLVADVDTGQKSDLHREMRVVRLGQGVDATGSLSEDAVERTRVALVDYADTCASLGVERVRMVATSATRDASNRSAFVSMVERSLHVLPEVISGDEEAALSFRGATADLLATPPFLVIDIGGGSTEFVVGSDKVEAALSVDIGCVRLTERHLIGDPPTAEQVSRARADIDLALSQVRDAVPTSSAGTAVGLAGSVTTVAALVLGLAAYLPERIHHARLQVVDVQRVAASLLAMTRAERAALPVMHPGRVDVIGAGALILARTMERLELGGLVVSESDILDGIALSMSS